MKSLQIPGGKQEAFPWKDTLLFHCLSFKSIAASVVHLTHLKLGFN